MIKLAVFRAAPPHKKEIYYTKKYSKKTGLSTNKSRHYAFIIYSVKTRFLRKEKKNVTSRYPFQFPAGSGIPMYFSVYAESEIINYISNYFNIIFG